MKQIVIAGRTGKAVELRRTQDGTPVLSFTMAVDDGWGDKKRTMWFDVSLFGKRGESLAQHIGKGAALTVSGDLSTREHDGKTYLTVRANELTLQGGKPEGERQSAPKQTYADASGSYGPDTGLDDEIPF